MLIVCPTEFIGSNPLDTRRIGGIWRDLSSTLRPHFSLDLPHHYLDVQYARAISSEGTACRGRPRSILRQSIRNTEFKANKTPFCGILRCPLKSVAHPPSVEGARSTNTSNQPSAAACFYASTRNSKYFKRNTDIC